MQQLPLLQTKLYMPPVRPGLVSRPRLIERLNKGLEGKLTLVSAPAGFGKTTLLSDWLSRAGREPAGPDRRADRLAWLSLDEGDADPARFLAYTVAAVRMVEAGAGQGAASLLRAAQSPPAEAVLTMLINDLAKLSRRLVLVLDDYHCPESQPVDEAVAFFIEHMPPQVHLVIATREDPHLPVARLRAQGQLAELRATDLRFSSAEAARFLNQAMGLGLSAQDIAALETRTEGWIAGLQMAALALQARQVAPPAGGPGAARGGPVTASLIDSFTGSHRFVMDYLLEEVLEQQPESVQTFLMQTAVLDRMAGPLCDCLTGQDNGQATLQALERANLFVIPLDEGRRWYRYHHLFAGLLRRRLGQLQPESVPSLQARASEWFEQHAFIDEAIDHAQRAGDLERVASLIEENFDAIFRRGEHLKLRRWLSGLPRRLVRTRPYLCILNAWELFTSGQQEEAERSLQAAEQALAESLEPDPGTRREERVRQQTSDRMAIRGRAAAIRAFLASYRGDGEATKRYALQALDCLPEEDRTWRATASVALGDAHNFAGDLEQAYRVRSEALAVGKSAGDPYLTLIAGMKLAVTERQRGRLPQVLGLCEELYQLAEESGVATTVAAGWLLAIWGEALAERNDLDGALAKASAGAGLTSRGQDLAMIGWSHLCLIRVLFSSGELDKAQKTIDKMDAIARQRHVPPWITNLTGAWQGRIWLAQRRLEDAAQWARERGLDAGQDPAILREPEFIVLARVLIEQGRPDDASGLLERILAPAEARAHVSRVIEILVVQALALGAAGDTGRALAKLERAVTLAEPGGFFRVFADEGAPLAPLLRRLHQRGPGNAYLSRLLGATGAKAGHRQATAAASDVAPVTGRPPPALVEPLSERELEVLGLMAEGYTNKEIATRLFVSLNTVKSHSRNIYGKLGVHSRTQAIARSQAWELLPRR